MLICIYAKAHQDAATKKCQEVVFLRFKIEFCVWKVVERVGMSVNYFLNKFDFILFIFGCISF